MISQEPLVLMGLDRIHDSFRSICISENHSDEEDRLREVVGMLGLMGISFMQFEKTENGYKVFDEKKRILLLEYRNHKLFIDLDIIKFLFDLSAMKGDIGEEPQQPNHGREE